MDLTSDLGVSIISGLEYGLERWKWTMRWTMAFLCTAEGTISHCVLAFSSLSGLSEAVVEAY